MTTVAEKHNTQAIHPYTQLSIGATSMLAVLLLDNLWVSLTALVVFTVVGGWTRRYAATGAALIIGGLTALTFLLMYVPFGHNPVGALGPIQLTADGFATGRDLGIRFMALVMVGIVSIPLVNIPTLLKAMQPHVPAPLVYMIGNALRLIPMAQQRYTFMKEIQQSRGTYPRHWYGRIHSLGVPMITGLVNEASVRGKPLGRMGVALPGPRTVMDPVPNPARQRIFRWLLLTVVVGLIIWTMAGGAG